MTNENTSRAYTVEEMRDMFMDGLKSKAHYWSQQKCDSELDRCMGLLHSVLATFDGCTDLPAFDITPNLEEGDMKYHIDNDENYWQKGVVINECHLHERLYE